MNLLNKANTSAFTDIISKSTAINGNISFTGNMHVFGQVTGETIFGYPEGSTLELMTGAVVDACQKISADHIVIDCDLMNCEVIARKSLSIKRAAKLKNVKITTATSQLQIAKGATLSGVLFTEDGDV